MCTQVSLQARMGDELDSVRDQVDILREGRHECARYGQEVGDIKSRLVLLETSANTSGHQDTTDYLGNMSQRNNQLDETTVMPSQVSLNWDPRMFKFTTVLHGHWPLEWGPRDDKFNLSENPQFSLRVNNNTTGTDPIWLLLS